MGAPVKIMWITTPGYLYTVCKKLPEDMGNNLKYVATSITLAFFVGFGSILVDGVLSITG